jgi:hypothetical protein
LNVTVVVQNRDSTSIYYYSGFTLDFVESREESASSNAQTSEPSMESSASGPTFTPSPSSSSSPPFSDNTPLNPYWQLVPSSPSVTVSTTSTNNYWQVSEGAPSSPIPTTNAPTNGYWLVPDQAVVIPTTAPAIATEEPNNAPILSPSTEPTNAPTAEPTSSPTESPLTDVPSLFPTDTPSSFFDSGLDASTRPPTPNPAQEDHGSQEVIVENLPPLTDVDECTEENPCGVCEGGKYTFEKSNMLKLGTFIFIIVQ